MHAEGSNLKWMMASMFVPEFDALKVLLDFVAFRDARPTYDERDGQGDWDLAHTE